jgi:hypothetical protein
VKDGPMTKPWLPTTIKTETHLILVGVAGLIAGTLATAVQMLMWWLSATPVFETLLRDARLTAAIVMGRGVLTSVPAGRWDVLLVATFIHFSLSVVYAAIAMPFVRRLSAMLAILTGAVYGLAIYGVNLHGLTALVPWFSVSRGWVTMLVHVVFGVTLAGACRFLGLADAGRRSPLDAIRSADWKGLD